MKNYIVLYESCNQSIMDQALRAPRGFIADCDTKNQAMILAQHNHPDCNIVWVEETDDYFTALDSYYCFLHNNSVS